MPEIHIHTTLEEWPGSSVMPSIKSGYARRAASDFNDEPAKLTGRQAVFYRNLIRMAEELESGELPVDFINAEGIPTRMDVGCIKIAEHAGFIQRLEDDETGVVGSIRLAWRVTLG